MKEIITNLHIHTKFSDGSGTYKKILNAAYQAGLDVIIITDHNAKISNVENIYNVRNKNILLIIGEEIHDRDLIPQKNHLLVIGSVNELSKYASDTQTLINKANQCNAATFIAHPFESALPEFNEPAITWENWQVNNFSGIEIWNQLSELKEVSNNILGILFHALFPVFITNRPKPETLQKWDKLINKGEKIVAVGGSDSHALHMNYGFLKKTIFPYKFHFRGINTHLLINKELPDDYIAAKNMVINALKNGNCFVGYDWPAPTYGFRFSAQSVNKNVIMGDQIELDSPITLQISTPYKSLIRLFRNGNQIKSWGNHQSCCFTTKEPGVYRVECDINYLGSNRGWIFSNPIYII